MAIAQPITKEQDIRDQKEREKKEQAFLKQEKNSMPAANDARYNRPAANDANVDESERERLQQEANMLRDAQRRARILQEEAEISEMEEEMGSGSGDMKRKTESVKLSSYSAPLIVAVFKDLMDYTVVLALPGIGTVLSFCANTLILLLLFFPKRRYKIASNARIAIIDAFILIGLVPLEGLMFPFNLLPFTIAAVGMIYSVDKKFVAKRNAKTFDKKEMKGKLSAALRQAYADRAVPMKDKSGVRERMREAF
jgi:hypothetical protein